MPVGEAHVGEQQLVHVALPVDRARADENVLCLAPVRSCVHAQRAANRARDATVEREAGDAGVGGRARNLHVGHSRAGAHAAARLGCDVAKPAPKRITMPGMPPSRTSRLEPSPMTVTGSSLGARFKK